MAKKLRLILGDQLNYQHSWYSDINENTLYLIMELRQETDYVTHHIQKVIGFFAAMTEFSSFLKREGHDILYLQLNDAKNTGDLKQNIKSVVSQNGIECFEYQLPDEYRLDEQLKELCNELGIATKSYDTEHFISSRTELGEIFKGKKMAGQMGNERVMIENLEILKVLADKNLIVVKGSIPGSKGSTVIIEN